MFNQSSETTAPRVFEALNGSYLLSFYLDLPVDGTGADYCHQVCLLSTDLYFIPCECFVKPFNLLVLLFISNRINALGKLQQTGIKLLLLILKLGFSLLFLL